MIPPPLDEALENLDSCGRGLSLGHLEERLASERRNLPRVSFHKCARTNAYLLGTAKEGKWLCSKLNQ